MEQFEAFEPEKDETSLSLTEQESNCPDVRVWMNGVQELRSTAEQASGLKYLYDSLNRLVHSFRQTHHFAPDSADAFCGWHSFPAHYRITLEGAEARLAALPEETQSAIRELSSEEIYRSIRQAGRMRASRSLPDNYPYMEELLAEIRAALVWLAEYSENEARSYEK